MDNTRNGGFRLTVLHSGITLTVEEALEIQADQLAHYEQHCPGITEKIRSVTLPFLLKPGVEYPIDEIDACVPRGGKIEWYMQQMNSRKGSA